MRQRMQSTSLSALGFAVFALLALHPATAGAGWHARQVSRGEAAGPTANESSDLYYQDGRLRIDQGTRSSMILHMRTGRLTLLDHERKLYIDDSVEQRVAQQKKMLETLKARRSELPPEHQKRFDEELARMEKGPSAPKPKATGKKDKVGAWSCEVHSIEDENMQGELCLARNIGVTLEDFAKDAKTFGALMQKLGTQPPGAHLLLEVAERGFPVRTKQKVRLSKSGPWLEGSSEVEVFESMDVPASRFEVPTGYTKQVMGPGRPGGPQAAPR